LIEGRRVVLVDDAISTGATAVASWHLLQKVGVKVIGMVVAMKQTNRWEAPAAALSAPLAVRAVFGCPLFERSDEGWIPLTETQPSVP
jgi:adenine/guanine phosphoribosyltransferase-like PRPP-binding protein